MKISFLILTDVLINVVLYYNRIDLSEEIDLAKSNNGKECIVCHYWNFNRGFKFHYFACNCCNDLVMLRLNLSDISIATVKEVNHRCVFHEISKIEAIICKEVYYN